MADGFWRRAQKGEQQYWQSDLARLSEGDPAKRYAYWNSHLEIIRRHRPFQAGDRVLDLGCGPAGIITAVEEFCQRYGVDPLMDFYRNRYELSSEIHYLKQMGENLQFADGFFQTVLCTNVLDHTLEPRVIWRELHRVLAPAGHLLVKVDVFHGFEYWRKRFKRWTRMARRRLEKHPHTFRVSDIADTARRTGFEILEQSLSRRRKRHVLLVLLRKGPLTGM